MSDHPVGLYSLIALYILAQFGYVILPDSIKELIWISAGQFTTSLLALALFISISYDKILLKIITFCVACYETFIFISDSWIAYYPYWAGILELGVFSLIGYNAFSRWFNISGHSSALKFKGVILRDRVKSILRKYYRG